MSISVCLHGLRRGANNSRFTYQTIYPNNHEHSPNVGTLLGRYIVGDSNDPEDPSAGLMLGQCRR